MERADRSVGPAVLNVDQWYGRGVTACIVQLCEAEPGREACGLVVARGEEREVVAVPNVADRYHAASPGDHPRTSRDGYVMDPRTLLRIFRALDERGGRVVAVWHSHVEAGAAFSAQDRADALAGGAPVLPGVEYVVVALRAGRAAEIRAFRFDGADYVDAGRIPP